MRELPILFSTPMVQALLAGRKTMTRRTKGLEDINKFSEMGYNLRYDSIEDGPDENGYVYFEINDHKGNPTEKYSKAKPKYQIGDLLWVKESYYAYGKWVKNGLTKKGSQKFKFVDLTADDYLYNDNHPKTIQQGHREVIGWYKRPSLFMPKAAARIWLKVTDIKVERLHDITEEDAIKEGIKTIEGLGYTHYTAHKIYTKSELEEACPYVESPIHSFLTLWEYINGEESLNANPWVFAYTFEIISTTGKPESHEQ